MMKKICNQNVRGEGKTLRGFYEEKKTLPPFPT
jgi:hypothetical protein